MFEKEFTQISIIIVSEDYNDCIVNQGFTKTYYRTNYFKNVVPYKYVVVIVFFFRRQEGKPEWERFSYRFSLRSIWTLRFQGGSTLGQR